MPTGPSVEREHKYLVRKVPKRLSTYAHQAIRQGYLVIGNDGRQVRLREIRRRGGTARPRYVLTVKAGRGSHTRHEEELTISADEFARLWPLTRGQRLEKTRYDIPIDGGLTVELDVYRGKLRGLVVAEVEFDSGKQARSFDPPGWLGKQIDHKKAYGNTNLARFGLPKR